jgi:hypothetical protein
MLGNFEFLLAGWTGLRINLERAQHLHPPSTGLLPGLVSGCGTRGRRYQPVVKVAKRDFAHRAYRVGGTDHLRELGKVLGKAIDLLEARKVTLRQGAIVAKFVAELFDLAREIMKHARDRSAQFRHHHAARSNSSLLMSFLRSSTMTI